MPRTPARRRLVDLAALLALIGMGLLIVRGWGEAQRRMAVANLVASLAGPPAPLLAPGEVPTGTRPLPEAVDPVALRAVRERDAEALAARAVAGALEAALARRDAPAIAGALLALEELGEPARVATPPVARAVVEAPGDRVRLRALHLLMVLDRGEAATVAALAAALKAPDRDDAPAGTLAAEAAAALGTLGPRAAPALADLVRLLFDPDRASFPAAAAALADLGTVAGPAVPVLTRLLGSGDARVRAAAVEVLGSIGPDAAPAVPALIRLLNTPEGLVSGRAAHALARIAPDDPRVRDALEPLGDDPDRDLRDAVRRSLSRDREADPDAP